MLNTCHTEGSLQTKNPKPFWRYIKSRKQDSTDISTSKRCGLLVSDNTRQAEILNEQFTSVCSQENTTAPTELEGDHFLSMPKLNIEVTGVEKLLQNLNPGKASGPDSVPNRILKLCAKELAPMLTFIFNQSLSLVVLPADWKLANITPIFKKGDRHLSENYRPVLLVCHVKFWSTLCVAT